MSAGAYVLAAGAGTRFVGSSHKLLARFMGSTVLGAALRAAEGAGLDAGVAVVSGAVDVSAAIPPTVRVVDNPRWPDGIATSLLAAADDARSRGLDAIVVTLGDQPSITSGALRAVAGACDDEHPMVFATYEGRRGHPVALHRTIWDLLPPSGDTGARVLARSNPELVVEVPCEGSPDDIDTVEDLQRWS